MRGSGNVITERREVSGYHAVDFSGVGELVIDQNGNEGLIVEGEDNILPFVRSEVSNGTLRIGLGGATPINPTRPLRFNLSARVMDGIYVSGAGTVKTAGLDAAGLQLGVSGAGGLDADNVSSGVLAVQVSGSGFVVASGKALSQQVVISGSGAYKAEDLASSTARVSISGMGTATVRVSETLDAQISGAGSVNYIGDPTISKHVTGLGSVTKLSDS